MTNQICVELPQPEEELAFTGERYVPTLASNIEAEHIHRYLFSAGFVKGKQVVDIACGEGYGSFILAQDAEFVLGVDISESAVTHAQGLYQRSNLRYQTGSCLKIPAEDKSVDVVISFETIEHIHEHEEFLAEIQRVLRPGGILCMSTPDKNISDEENEFHVRELTRSEFESLLGSVFPHVALYGQKGVFVSMLTSEQDESAPSKIFQKPSSNRYEELNGMPTPAYLVAIASLEPLGAQPSSLLMDDTFIPHFSALFGCYQAKLDEAFKELSKLQKQKTMLERQLKQSLEG